MAPLDVPSPSPSHMPPPILKRPRPSNTVPTATAVAAGAAPPRAKRRKPDDSFVDTAAERDRSGRPPFGMGMVRGREEEWGEPADIKTKIDFLELPVETLYRYLEYHDLLPRWNPSPWSEDPCIPPNALYSAVPPPAASAPSPQTQTVSPPPTSPSIAADDASKAVNGTAPPLTDPAPPTTATTDVDMASGAPADAASGDPKLEIEDDASEAAIAAVQEEDLHVPTTRSRTAPHRKPPTPSPRSPAPVEVKRGVMTLSDVHAARAVLAEKANAHWIKGLGGGQNQESSTIVAFLYKNKVGHGRLLRVYNPTPASYP